MGDRDRAAVTVETTRIATRAGQHRLRAGRAVEPLRRVVSFQAARIVLLGPLAGHDDALSAASIATPDVSVTRGRRDIAVHVADASSLLFRALPVLVGAGRWETRPGCGPW